MPPRRHSAAKTFLSIKEKIRLGRLVRQSRQSKETSIKELARQHNVQPCQLRKWERQLDLFLDLENTSKFTLRRGRMSQLAHIKDQLLHWLSNLRQEGAPVSMHMVIIQAMSLDRDFAQKNSAARYAAVRRLLKASGWSIRAKTREAQAAPVVAFAAAQEFVLSMRPFLTAENRHQDWIMNMDQTAVFFSMMPRTTIHQRGARTISVRSSSSSSVRITVAIPVTASGYILKPFITLKGKPGGRIERSLRDLPGEAAYAVQDNAWMDERIMLLWVETVLRPWAARAPPHIRPVLILDSYRCHVMDSVKRAIEELGVQVKFIPGGCTGLCQPVDVGVNKPFKSRMRAKWQEWLLERGINQQESTRSPDRQQICQWVIDSLTDIDVGMVKKAWRPSEMPYFLDYNEDGDLHDPPEVEVEDIADDNAVNEFVLYDDGDFDCYHDMDDGFN